ncbi:hypothetical protein, partial [Pseudomonas aeruginosa]|uniref:hypothetical protein n=1 Tax=Pseudomonas aeruginosa TaxID=287 RepID=UPI001ABC1627
MKCQSNHPIKDSHSVSAAALTDTFRAVTDTCRKSVEINGTESYGVRHQNGENSGIGTYSNASKHCFRGLKSGHATGR